MTCVISNQGTWWCKGDKKHCCFYLELNHGLNSGLKQRLHVSIELLKVVSKILEFFHTFSFFLKIKIPPFPPVRYHPGQIMFKDIHDCKRMFRNFAWFLGKKKYEAWNLISEFPKRPIHHGLVYCSHWFWWNQSQCWSVWCSATPNAWRRGHQIVF